jgi:predicted transcriptional regulator
MQRNSDTRFKILKTIIDAKKPLTLASIAKRMKIPSQKVAYHLEFHEDNGLIIKNEYEYFAQPVLIDPDLRQFCAEKIAEIIEAFSEHDSEIAVVNGQDPEDVILNTLYILVNLVLSEH